MFEMCEWLVFYSLSLLYDCMPDIGPCKKFEDTKWVIIISKSKTRKHNGQKKQDKRTNNDLQNITHKTKDRVTRIPTKTWGELRCPGKENSPCSTKGIRRVTLIISIKTKRLLHNIFHIGPGISPRLPYQTRQMVSSLEAFYRIL